MLQSTFLKWVKVCCFTLCSQKTLSIQGEKYRGGKEELMEGISAWLNSQVSDFFDADIQSFFLDTYAPIQAVA
jgi:hypothetical protein